MTISVRYGRFGGDYTDWFESFSEATEFIVAQEDRGEIFASTISDEKGLLYSSRHPLAKEGRWEKVRDDAPPLPEQMV